MRLKPTPERLYKKSKDIVSSSLLINDFGIREMILNDLEDVPVIYTH